MAAAQTPNERSAITTRRNSFAAATTKARDLRDLGPVRRADVINLLSNNSGVTLTPDGIRKIAAIEGELAPRTELPMFKAHRLEDRLGSEGVAEIVRRFEAGESARQLAEEYQVAASALLRLLRERNVVVRKRVITDNETQELARQYEAGATMAELEATHRLSHGAVFRALRRAGVVTRPSAPRRKLA